ncbi:DNA replication regulator SLD3-domain-containing protein [Aspergillus cavernicola]|uniref:DNA replication regulator SLD3-domain-containing protein n=1 Tax=Aspergillus cavernicola TaxID=176166 RepID=A0ABR4IWL4_9EURO
MASRGSLNVLEPIPLNQLCDAQPTLRKRKRGTVSDVRATENIVIRAHAASLSDHPYVLEPIAVIPRTQLPFDWLDVPSALSQIQSGSLFVANIPVLEVDSHHEPGVLVVRLALDGGLYVIERVKGVIYTLIKLVRGVEEGDVHVVVRAASHRVTGLGPCTPRKQLDGVSEGNWWRHAQVEDPAPDLSVQIPAKRAKIDFVFGVSDDHLDRDERMQGMSPMDLMDRSSSCDLRMISVPPELQDQGEPVVSREIGEGNTHEPTQSPQELLDSLREQYLQALYVSKASVAYFAKGPLSRCRATFQPPEHNAGKVSELVEFYRTIILAAKKMDLKYRETLPATLHDIVLTISDDEAVPKKRKSKKKTLGRNGLYPEEQDFIRQCWKNRMLAETGASVEISRDAEIKKHVSDLRLRETQLQMLLILETIALEAATKDEANNAGQGEGSVDATSQPKPKTKKPQDLNVMLELHLDRLCIWHTVSFDDVPVSESQAGSNQAGKAGGNDAMRDFCTEVIIPFYASRLPDRCKSITRKLGVSVGTVSPFPKTAKKPSRKEGTSLERNPSQKQSRRSLQRVLTDERAASQGRSQPSLNRSITAPSQIESKRETTPLLPSLSASVRGGIQKAKRVENREVDLMAVARQHETKLKRVQLLAEQKKELDAAILALRKPNRELVAKDIAEDVEKRITSSSSRKPKNPVRNPLGQGVQVMATPSKSRKRDAVAGLPPLPKNITRSKHKGKSTSFSSPFNSEPQVIPGSTIRPISFSGAAFTADSAVQETPSRRPPQPLISSNDSAERNVAESPIPGGGNIFRVPRRPAPRPMETEPLTPVRSQQVHVPDTDTDVDMASDTPQTRFPPPPLFALPRKPTASTQPQSSMIFDTPPKPGPVPVQLSSRRHSTAGPSKPAAVVPVTPEKSIYSALGWDDDDDDDLAL